MNARPHGHVLLWLVVLALVVVNAGLVAALLSVRAQAGEGARAAAQAVAALRGSTIDYTVRLDQSLPVSFTVPLSATLIVPINADLPIDTEFTLSLRTGFGDFPVTLPVKATVPVRMEQQVPVRMSVPVSASVPVALDVPVHLALAQTAFGRSLEGIQAYLEQAADGLQGSLLPWGGR